MENNRLEFTDAYGDNLTIERFFGDGKSRIFVSPFKTMPRLAFYDPEVIREIARALFNGASWVEDKNNEKT